jgi:hypothetical protein
MKKILDAFYASLYLGGLAAILLWVSFLFIDNFYIRVGLILLALFGIIKYAIGDYKKDEVDDDSIITTQKYIFTLEELIEILDKPLEKREIFIKRYSFTKLTTTPTPAMNNMSLFTGIDSRIYTSNDVLIYQTEMRNAEDFINQAIKSNFRLISDKNEIDGNIITYKKAERHLDFLNPKSQLKIAIYKTKLGYRGNLNGLDFNN